MLKEKIQRNHLTNRFSKWSSLYNNFHPSKRLPSFSAAFFMFSLCFFSGTESDFRLASSAEKNEAKQTLAVLHSSNKIQKSDKVHSETIKLISKSISTKKAKNIIPEISTPEIKQITAISGNNREVNSDLINNQPGGSAFGLMTSSNQSKYIKRQERFIKNPPGPIHYELYATPSLMNQTNLNFDQKNKAESGSLNNSDENYTKYSVSIYKKQEIEAGGALLFDINQTFRLKAGMQLSYVNYAMEQSSEMAEKSTDLSGYNSSKNNIIASSDVYQLSIPLGTEWKLIGNGWIDWFAGATVQPTITLSDHSFFRKDDLLNNLEDKSIFRKWNLHSTFETFLNYHLTKNTSIKLGPQIRYQFMPSLLPNYNVTERLYNVGLKLGLTGSF